jgi:hypothetical protein
MNTKNKNYVIQLSSLAMDYGNLRLMLRVTIQNYDKWNQASSTIHLLKLINRQSNQLKQLESAYSDTIINLSPESLAVVKNVYPDYNKDDINLVEFLRCYTKCMSTGPYHNDDITANLVLNDSIYLPIDIPSIEALHSEHLASNMMNKAVKLFDGNFLI